MSEVADDPSHDEIESTTVYWDGLVPSSLAAALAKPTIQCIERDLAGSHHRRERARTVCRHLGLVLTTRSAYRCAVAKTFIAAVAERVALSDDVRERAHTALQEALMNAVLHGNLGLDSALRDDLAGLDKTHQQIEQLLANPQTALSAVRIDALWNSALLMIMVADSGGGFERSRLPSADDWAAAGHLGSGRGFLILEAFCDRLALLRGGTVIRLGFHL
jgi:anti-sigma regulatory factor (Ser/Thr protein kinase)